LNVASFIGPDNPLADAARSFLTAGIAEDKNRARQILEDSLRSGVSGEEIYRNVLEPVLKETGNLWQLGTVSIAQEHFITALIETFMSLLHDQLISSSGRKKIRRQKSVVAASVGSELHEIGIHIVADFFEMDGWATYYFGGNTPVGSILEAVRDHNADVIALSTTMARFLPEVGYLVRSLRADKTTLRAKIIVGGYPFRVVPDLWQQIGADAYAGTAEEAVTIANHLINKRD
jgi:methanogenic corrinoid protein MtbC1